MEHRLTTEAPDVEGTPHCFCSCGKVFHAPSDREVLEELAGHLDRIFWANNPPLQQ